MGSDVHMNNGMRDFIEAGSMEYGTLEEMSPVLRDADVTAIAESLAEAGEDPTIKIPPFLRREYTRTQAHMHTGTQAQMHRCRCTHAHMYTCTHAHMPTCPHAHMHTCTHAHMHTCTHARTGARPPDTHHERACGRILRDARQGASRCRYLGGATCQPGRGRRSCGRARALPRRVEHSDGR